MSKNIIKKPVNKKVKLLKMIFSALGTTVSIQLATAVVLGAKSIKDLQDQNWKAEFNRILASNSVLILNQIYNLFVKIQLNYIEKLIT